MSREIKFRVWYPDYKKMHTGDEIDFGNACMDIRNGKLIFNIYEIDYDEAPEYFTESGYVLMQFTGLRDKNGKEVYEGDIIANGDTKPAILQVKFLEGGFCCTAEGILPIDLNCFYPSIGCRFEVIGNIYENPELMDGAK